MSQPAHRNNYSLVRLQRAMSQFVGGRILQAVGQAMLVMVLVRVLSAHEFGVYMLVIGLAEAMLALGSLGTLQVARRYLPQMISHLPAPRLFRFVFTLFGVQLAALLLLAGLTWHFWPRLAQFIGLSPAHSATAATGIALFVLVPSVNFACEMLDALLEQGRSRLAGSLLVYSRLTVLALLLVSAVHIDLALVLRIDVAIVSTVALVAWLLVCVSLWALHSRGATGAVPWRDIFRFARHMAPMDMLGVASMPGAFRLVLAGALGVAESGLFAFLQSLQRLVGRYLPGTLLRGMVMPVLVSRAYQPGGRAILEMGASLLVKSNLLIIAAGTVAIAACGDELVALLSGGRFHGAGRTLLLMYLALAVTSQRNIIEMVMQITGHAAVLGRTALIPPVALAVMWAVADRGIEAAVLVLIGASALANGIATAVLVRDPGGFNMEWRGQLAIVLTAAASAGGGAALTAIGMPALLSAVLALAAFAALQLLFRPFTEAETGAVGKVLGRRLGALLQHLARADATERSGRAGDARRH